MAHPVHTVREQMQERPNNILTSKWRFLKMHTEPEVNCFYLFTHFAPVLSLEEFPSQGLVNIFNTNVFFEFGSNRKVY